MGYKSDYYKGSSSMFVQIFFPLSNIFYALRKNILPNKEFGIWVDVGAGDGRFLSIVGARRKIGVEKSCSGRDEIIMRGQEAMAESWFLNSKQLNADVISFWHSLEHIDNPSLYVKTAFGNLKKSGWIIVAVPNFDSWERKHFKGRWFHLAQGYHLWHFCIPSIEYLLKDAGFKIRKIDHWCPEHHFSGLLQSFINDYTNSQNILHKLIRRRSGNIKISGNDWLWCVFWLTAGMPYVLIIWIINSLLKKPGAIIVVAQK